MGNFCSQIKRQTQVSTYQENHNRNKMVCEFKINQNSRIQLIVGSYRYHESDLLLAFSQYQYIQYLPQIKDYAQNYLQFIQSINKYSKRIINVHIDENCPYNRVNLVLLSCYNNQQTETYYKQFESIISQILNTSSQFTIQLYQSSQNGKGIPNQTLISQFINFLMNCSKPIAIYLISDQIKLLNIVRYEMAKRGFYKPLTNPKKDQY